jgi:cobalamin synthase
MEEMLVFMERREMHLLSILPDQRTGNTAITTSTSFMLIFWLAFEGLLHERKLLLHPPSSFGSPS